MGYAVDGTEMIAMVSNVRSAFPADSLNPIPFQEYYTFHWHIVAPPEAQCDLCNKG